MPYRYMALVFVFLKCIYTSIFIEFSHTFTTMMIRGGYSRSKVTGMIERFWGFEIFKFSG